MRTDRSRQRFYAAGWIISAGVMAVAGGMWQLHLREVEQRAEEAERTRDEAARRMAMEERLRIARELHDSLTHSISVIQVQAGVAVHLARKRGEDVPPALAAIQEAGADAARELRATLGVLRSEEDGDGSGLGQLDSLVARARAAGLPVTVTVTGAQRPLPPEVDQAAYRIVQEALTNVSRHAGHACASVRLHYAPETLSVQVDDDGKGPVISAGTSTGARPSGPGLGLVGMRERVSALGGQLQAGPQDDGGFRVRAELPARAPS
jgi:signal transduction histidine kinase